MKEKHTIWSPRTSDWIRAWQLTVIEFFQGIDFADLVSMSVKRINIKTSFYEG